MATFDWKNPDYVSVFKQRVAALQRLRAEPKVVPALRLYYRENIPAFINDWGVTEDPRNVEVGLPTIMPFILFPRQEEWVWWLLDLWRNRKPGITEKTRDMGMSWLAVSTACSLATLHDGFTAGFGSRKEEYVDKIGDPKALFYKARVFMNHIPREFRAGWSEKTSAHMRLGFPQTGSTITGEAGDQIGRGDRASMYIVDESAHLIRPELIEASLSATTNCRQDISSVNGRLNPFATKRHGGKIAVFTFHWRDDPRKDDVWYAKKKDELDPVVLAQEIDINYDASVEGVVIPYAWVRAAIDAHIVLDIEPSGEASGSLDVADEGKDHNAFAGAKGILINRLEEWSGAGGDIFNTVERSFTFCDVWGYSKFRYDADGLGAGVRGDARIINETRKKEGRKQHEVITFRGSAGVVNPNGEDVKGRKNLDFFQNFKAQSWWSLRTRFQKTYRWIAEGRACDPDEIISISSQLVLKDRLCAELAQPTYVTNQLGKIVIDKIPDGAKSPNLADSIMIQFSPLSRAPMRINQTALNNA